MKIQKRLPRPGTVFGASLLFCSRGTKAACAAAGFLQLVYLVKAYRKHRCDHHLCDTLARSDSLRLRGMVMQCDHKFPTVIAVDGSNAIDKTDPA